MMISLIQPIRHLSDLDVLTIGAVWILSQLAQRLGMIFYSLFSLPGTLMHELAHYLCAVIFVARPSFPSIIPMRQNGYWRLGSVKFSPTFLNVVPISMAPMILLPAGIAYGVFIMHKAHGETYLFHAWITGTVIQASMPSTADWKIALPVLLGVSLIGALIFWVSGLNGG